LIVHHPIAAHEIESTTVRQAGEGALDSPSAGEEEIFAVAYLQRRPLRSKGIANDADPE
jgi:hypothetical protein